ncbi:MAG: hypothetical protein GFH27_549313n69 [Chloroflexi bacterium AL-W]|nr:hypothetical protein [Chloroflexi bacterium AL-N1]NOK69492.1 hypothetical protein [Chloroflexi bacterium AL-N10]NOK77457.1 hypothetical protein [Chloroflexi bacterium AL-N5]NOK84308.1 hypothetical protein [Chloroflexi bacterium AL-W]NOK91526.1 hypothetical protein [Chloroflexi bacterium AL-N15]
MESNGRKLGWLALGIGVIALFMSLVGRSATPAVNIYESGSETPYSSEAHEERSREGFAQREDGPRGFEQRFEEKRYERHGWRDRDGHHRHDDFGPGPFFLFPFFLLGGLFKTILLGIIIGFALRFWFRRSGRGGGSDPDPQSSAGETRSV